MVGEEMAADLLAFGKPILVLGDPGQLPPIKGTGAFTMATPDIMLTEIHRQAEESAIIRLATMARQGIEIPPGAHDAHVWKMPRRTVGPEQMLRGGQVICGRNNTRLWLNSQMKAAAGFPFAYPQGCDEKIICLKNRHDLGLINGMFVKGHYRRLIDSKSNASGRLVTREDGMRTTQLLRIPGSTSDPLTEGQAAARQRIAAVLNLFGGADSAGGSCLWHVLGLECSLREWATRQGWSGRSVHHVQAQGILLTALGVLAVHYGLQTKARDAQALAEGGLEIVHRGHQHHRIGR